MDDGSKSAAEQKKPNEEPDRQQPDKTRAGKRSVLSGILGRLKGAPDVTEEDIRSIVSEGQEQGVLEASEADMISNIFEFSDKQAQDIMTNRVSIVAVDGSMTLEEALHFMLEGNNSRFPVYLENIDHIIGILNIRDAVKRLYEGDANDLPIRKIKGLLRHPRFVPETRNIDKLFRSMQSSKTQMVIVIDEYGQTAGLVSMEDILEEIVGNILDEYDEDEVTIEPTGNAGEFLIEGRTPLADLEKHFGIDFNEENFETLNGFLIARLDGIPEEGSSTDFSVDVGNYEFRINEVRNHRITNVLVRKKSAEDPIVTQDREEHAETQEE
ncbi:MAG: HlyC/CorC family transporter [Lachnospiraceae bacterium]|nr:HlyC/CorC family transporter [Lachnospiraceae bacterium]